MRIAVLLREALASARSALVPSLLVLLVVGAMCLACVLTVGRQAATEQAIAEELSGPAARVLTLTDNGSSALTDATVQTLTGLDTAASVIAQQIPVDTVNGALGDGSTPIPLSGVTGTVDTSIELTRGRMPAAGEVVLPEAKLAEFGFAEPSGFLEASDGRQWAVVGAFTAEEPFSDLTDYALAAPTGTDHVSFQTVRVLAADVSSVRALQTAVLAVVDPAENDVRVQTASALSEQNRAVTGQLAGLGRSLLVLILGAGAFFVAIVVLSDVLIRRRDLGRRRTLGITRADLVGLVAARTGVPAVLGAVLGSGIGYAVLLSQGNGLGLDFVAAVAVLAALTAVAASLPPATFAAFRDPVRVMRTA